ncbi:MAG: DUF3592 domain-containing protein [Chloroflexota bacterium]
MSARRSRRGGIRLPGIIGGPIIFIIGGAMAYFGWNMRLKDQAYVDAAESADGTVVQVDSVQKSDGDILYHPVIEFTTVGGEDIEYRVSSGSNPPAFKVGEQVEVLYNPDFPADAHVNSFLDLWLFSTILLVFGGFFLLAGVLSFFQSLLTILGIGGLLGIGAWLALRGKKDKEADG